MSNKPTARLVGKTAILYLPNIWGAFTTSTQNTNRLLLADVLSQKVHGSKVYLRVRQHLSTRAYGPPAIVNETILKKSFLGSLGLQARLMYASNLALEEFNIDTRSIKSASAICDTPTEPDIRKASLVYKHIWCAGQLVLMRDISYYACSENISSDKGVYTHHFRILSRCRQLISDLRTASVGENNFADLITSQTLEIKKAFLDGITINNNWPGSAILKRSKKVRASQRKRLRSRYKDLPETRNFYLRADN